MSMVGVPCGRTHEYHKADRPAGNGLSTLMTTLEKLEMSGNLEHVREMSGQKCCHGKVSQNCSLLVEYWRNSTQLHI